MSDDMAERFALEMAKKDAELERERMRLAACGVAAMANTEGTVAARLEIGHPFYSASYGDVCAAVDREMSLRRMLDNAEKAHAAKVADICNLGDNLTVTEAALAGASEKIERALRLLKSESDRIRNSNCECGSEESGYDSSKTIICYAHEAIGKAHAILAPKPSAVSA
jgi:hypothetical protein